MPTIPWQDILNILPSLLWFFLTVLALLIFRKPIRELVSIMIWRVRTGSQLKIASFEIGISQYYVSPSGEKKNDGVYEVRQDEDGYRFKERDSYYRPNRRIFMVHKITPSEKEKQLYDILIYLIPHKDATLINVSKVDYYFGKYWGNSIFTSIDRANGFPISTSAYGPLVCTAEIHFSDGEKCMTWRYIDFEMGSIGTTPML